MTATPLDLVRCPLDGVQLIEASAGTGKTWNICGLVLRLLLERQLEITQILVVSFTKAATAELRERIRARVAEALQQLRGRPPAPGDAFIGTLLARLRSEHGQSDEAMARRLDQALQTFDEAAIFTIHGFCQRALADAAFSSGVPMAQELLADDSALRLQAVQDFWRRCVAGGDGVPAALAAHLVRRGDSPEAWSALLQRHLAKPLSRLVWPAHIDAAGSDGSELAAAHAAARTLWLREREAIVGSVNDALPRLNGTRYKPAALATAAASWDALLAAPDPLVDPGPLDKLDLFARASLQPKKNQAPPADHAFFDRAEALLARRQARDEALEAARLRLLRELLDAAPQALQQAKQERRVLAFDDLLFELHRRLAGAGGPALAAALRARFPAALIDEFQDTDPLQFAIFRAIYGDEAAGLPLFLVGDPKQAIYSFRGADLHTYLQARRQARAEYTLADNQRSTAPLLAALNALFGGHPRAFMLPGLDYRPVRYGAKPRQALQDDSAERAALQLWTLPQGEDGTPLPKASARQAAAQACAGEIARLLGAAQRGEVRLDGRPLSAADLAVLVRSHSQGSEMRRALATLGIASVELSQASVFASPDAEELETVLAAMLEPTRDRLLRAALATTLMGLDAQALDKLSADADALLERMTRLAEDRQAWLAQGVGVMLRRWMAREAVTERLLARPDGERRLTNLLHLAELLQQAAQTEPAPEALLRWLQAQRQDPRSDDATQLRLESDRHLVQIVTIHKSKGLEYPIVFCPFLWDGRSGGGGERVEGREYHAPDGRAVLDFSAGGDSEEVKAQRALERTAEDLRLVYVALTRAVHRCYLPVGCYTSGPHASSTESGRSLLHWLVAGAADTPEAWRKHRLAPADLQAAWAALARAQAPHIALAPLPDLRPSPLPALRAAPGTLAARVPPHLIAAPWRIGSYSSLARGLQHERAALDHDLHLAAPADDAEPAAALDADDILRFPRGPMAGECLHAVFEHADFGDAATWPGAIARALQLRPQAAADAAEQAQHPAMLQRLLADVLHTALPWGLRLADVRPARRRVEMEFNLPVARLGARALGSALAAHGWPVPPLAFGTLSGYLRGFIDLVFEQDGRFYIVDWKSNHLGLRPGDYAAAALAQAVQTHGYQLQALLYALAVHRWLRHRLPDYRYDTHFGGVGVLFVRGVRPGWTGADGTPNGVWARRPTAALIERLSSLLDDGEAAA